MLRKLPPIDLRHRLRHAGAFNRRSTLRLHKEAKMKTQFLAEWETMKKAFDKAAKAAKPNDAITKSFLATMAKPTGLTPILKDIDAAFASNERKPATDALLKFYGKREPVSKLMAKVLPDIGDPALNDAVMDLMAALPALEKSIQGKVKQLQDQKAGAKDASNWNLLLLFETDLRKNINQLAKDLKPAALAKIEKNNEVLSLSETAVKHMDAYSKAAARLKADEALKSLKAFVKEAENCARACETVVKQVNDDDYGKAVKRFVNDLRTLCNARVAVQQKKLEEHLKA